MADWADAKANEVVQRSFEDPLAPMAPLIAAALREARLAGARAVLVMEPTEAMLYEGRAPVLAHDLVTSRWTLRQHCGEAFGIEPPAWARDYRDDKHIPKAACAHMVWRAMCAAVTPEQIVGESDA